MPALSWRLVFLFLSISSVQAFESLDLQLDSFERGDFSAQGLHVKFNPVQTRDPGLSIHIRKIELPFFKTAVAAELSCPRAVYLPTQLTCKDGAIVLRTAERQVLQVKFNASFQIPDMQGRASFSLRSIWGKLRSEFNIGKGQKWQLSFDGENLQLPVLSGQLVSGLAFLQSHKITKGGMNLKVSAEGAGSRAREIRISAGVKELSVEGESILEKVNLSLESDLKQEDERWLFTQRIEASKGEMYLQPGLSLLGEKPGFYLDTSSSTLTGLLQGSWLAGENLLHLDKLSYSHPGVLELAGRASVIRKEVLSLPVLSISVSLEDLAKTYPVYLQPILLHTNFSDLDLSGTTKIVLDYRNNSLHALELSIDEVGLDDRKSRFSISGLNSDIRLSNDEDKLRSILNWAEMSFYRLDLGHGSIVFESVDRNIRVLDWQDVPILDGTLVIDEFDLKNVASRDFSMSLGGRLKPISMQRLTQAMGWTVFPGALSGEISGLKYAANKLQLEGDIHISVFGGALNIQNLQIDDLFSSYSTLATDIRIERLDLEQMTDVFSFGKIEGSLSGLVNKLRLEDWQPRYFEAEFATPADDEFPHRISQRALENLNEIGGGLSGTLSRGFLRFLPAYSYGRFGFSCRLLNGVCELGGVKDSGDNFYILTKGGLFPPWVEVKGAGRAIKWDDLIGGLKQISSGEVAIE